MIESVSFAKGVIAVTYLEERRRTSSRCSTLDGQVARPIVQAARHRLGRARDRGGSHRGVPHVHELQLSDDDLPGGSRRSRPPRRELWERPAVPVDPATVEVEQVWYPSKDGTKISMFLVHKKGLRQGRRRRRRCSTATADSTSARRRRSPRTLFQWFEAGGLFALPNLRGGGEYGDAWHEAGMLDQEAERLRRLHRRGRVADREQVHEPATAGDRRRLERRPADRRARSRSGPICFARRSSPCRCSTCCATRTS